MYIEFGNGSFKTWSALRVLMKRECCGHPLAVLVKFIPSAVQIV